MATRHGKTRSQGSQIVSAAALIATLWPAAIRAQLPLQPEGSPFEMVGFIQSATLNDAADVFSGGAITMNTHVIVVPRNTVLQMPATALTWAELFKLAPPPYGPTQTGLALADVPTPKTTYEVLVQGNRVGDVYIAGLIFLSQQALNVHQGFINAIDYTAGEMRVGGTPRVPTSGTRVRLNDPIGRYGRALSNDVRFAIDEDNPTVRSETAFPMCLPRTDPAVADDPLCPQGNRPIDPATGRFQTTYTMPAPPALPDARRMAPFEVGDFVTVNGNLVDDAAGSYISAWSVVANVGIFTAPGTLPAYVAIDVLLMGTGPTADVTLAQEGARRTRVEGFTTDPSMPIDIYAIDVDPCTGIESTRYWGTQSVDQGPPRGAVAGRWRFRPSLPLFDLKGFPFLPPTREVLATSIAGTVMTTNGLIAGAYQAPNFEFVFPENRGVGNPPVPENLDTMPFLAQGMGPWFGGGPRPTLLPQGLVGQLSPWPGAAVPEAATCSTATINAPVAQAGANQTVNTGSVVTLDGSSSADANAPALPLAYSWSQLSGPAVALQKATSAAATFAAPSLAAGATPLSLSFLLTVANGTYASTATVSVTVIPAPAASIQTAAHALSAQ